jgi:flagellar basal-body rod protein FlgC
MSFFPSLPSSTMHQSLNILAQGIQNQGIRANIAVQNYVNADTTAATPGGKPYQRRTVVFKDHIDTKTGTHIPLLEKVGVDQAPFTKVYEPSHPAADVNGHVLQPNVNRYFETADFQEANLQMSGCARLYESTTVMIQRTHDLMIKA